MKNPEHADGDQQADRYADLSVEALYHRGNAKWAAFPDTLGAFIAEMDFGTAPGVEQVIQDQVAKLNFGYPTPQLRNELTAATAQWYAQHFNFHIPATQVFPATDVLTSLALAIDVFTGADDKIIVPTPSYMPFLQLPKTSEREILEVPLQRSEQAWNIDYALLEQAFLAGGKMLVLTNPHNPIGHCYTRDELSEIATIVARHDGVVFADELHSPLTFAGVTHVPYASVSDAARTHTITAFAASKAWNVPGLKCAQLLIGNPEWAEHWRVRAQRLADGASTLGIYANIAAYTSEPDWPSEIMTYLQANVDLIGQTLAEQLPEAVFVPPQGTYLAWIDLGAYPIAGSTWAEALHTHGRVVVTEGESCGQVGAGAIRLNFATPKHILIQVLDKIVATVQTVIQSSAQN